MHCNNKLAKPSPMFHMAALSLAYCCFLLLPVAIGINMSEFQHKESAEYQAINTYLTAALMPPIIESEVVVPHIKAAIELIELYGIEDFSWMQPNEELFDSKFNGLLGHDAKVELTILNNFLAAATETCHEEILDFLLRVLEKHTFEGQILNQISQKLLDKCLDANASSLAMRIERSVGKISSPVFDFVTEIAGKTATRLDDANRVADWRPRSRGLLKIDDGQKIYDLRDNRIRAQLLKGVRFDNLRQFALVINELFGSTLPADERYKPGNFYGPTWREEVEKLHKFYKDSLIEPCDDVVQRVKDAYSPLLKYNRKQPSRTISAILDAERTTNPNLDFQLEVYRICRMARINEADIWNLLKSMR